MSKVRMPLMSEKASGKFADGLVYYERYGKTICRRYVKNDGGDSEVSRKNRNLFKEAIEFSKLLTLRDRAAWNQMSQGTNLNGHNLFMRTAMNCLHQGHDFKPIYGVEYVIRPEESRESACPGDPVNPIDSLEPVGSGKSVDSVKPLDSYDSAVSAVSVDSTDSANSIDCSLELVVKYQALNITC